jgi:hypothetical protein
MAALTAAIIAGSAIAAGSQIAAAKMASGAAKEAAKTQVASGEKALDLQREMYQQNRADFQPYLQGGTQAFNTLSGLMGLGGGGAPQQQPTMSLGAPSPAKMLPDGRIRPEGAETIGHAVYRGTGQPYQPGNRSGYSAASTPQSSYAMVTLRAPDGTTKTVPADQAAYYQSKGATLVTGQAVPRG